MSPESNHSSTFPPRPVSIRLRSVLLWSVLVGLVFIAIQSGMAHLYMNYWDDPAGYASKAVQVAGLQGNADLISIMTVVTSSICSALIMVLLSRHRVGVMDYLALKPAAIQSFVIWLSILFAFSMITNLVASYFEHDVGFEFARQLYRNAGNTYLLVFAVVVAGPFFEELFFRGFLYRGLADSRIGVVGAIVLTSLVWTVIHGQYDWYVKVLIFIIGILLGMARDRSGSIFPPLAMHVMMNGMTMIEVASL